MTTLAERIQWTRFPVGAGAAVGNVELAMGTVGEGSPVAVISAGVHGDEGPWGAWAIHKLLASVDMAELQGSLRVLPVANPLAMEADLRNAPLDTLDLNRVFPGDERGSHTERLAAAITRNALEGVNVVIDIHGGGSWCVNSFVFKFPGGEALADAVHAPFITMGADRAVTLTGYAKSALNASVTAIEMGGRSQYEGEWANRIAAALRRVLGVAGVLTTVPDSGVPSIPVSPSTVLRPARGGIFIPVLRAEVVGTIVPEGTALGHLLDPVTYAEVETFRAPFRQTALMLLRPMVARIEGGAMTYVVAEPLS